MVQIKPDWSGLVLSAQNESYNSDTGPMCNKIPKQINIGLLQLSTRFCDEAHKRELKGTEFKMDYMIRSQ